ncbi:MAG: hypothetical protein AB1412_09420 [Pseudomonadota bacterium]
MSAKPAAKPARITTAGKAMTLKRVAVRLRVGQGQRYRAGLGPFGAQEVEIEADAQAIATLRADPHLVVRDVIGNIDVTKNEISGD